MPTKFFCDLFIVSIICIDIFEYLKVIWMFNDCVKEFWDMSIPLVFLFLFFFFGKFSLTSIIFINNELMMDMTII